MVVVLVLTSANLSQCCAHLVRQNKRAAQPVSQQCKHKPGLGQTFTAFGSCKDSLVLSCCEDMMHVLRTLVMLVFACLIVTVIPVAGVSAMEVLPRSSSLVLKGEAPVPAGYLVLCQSWPRLCSFGRARKGHSLKLARLTPARFDELRAVTLIVNRSMRAVEDRTRFGVADRWTVGGAVGDCEDFAITKRKLLLARGWPPAAVLVAIVSLHGSQHAVLVARTDGGDFVLDNFNSAVTPWRSTSYVWQKIQGPDSFSWRAL